MKIFIKAKPGAARAYVKEEPRGLFEDGGGAGKHGETPARRFVVAVTERAVEGRANEAIIAALAAHFGVPRARVRIVRGAQSREKIVEVDEG